MYEDRLTFMK